MLYNPKLKDLIEKKEITVMGLFFAGWWRWAILIYGIAIVVGILIVGLFSLFGQVENTTKSEQATSIQSTYQALEETVAERQTGWYAVTLLNNEIFYGQIIDSFTDPIKIENVYYDYDQINSGVDAVSGNLRLVKRGRETHGPDGAMEVFRKNIAYTEQLKEDSKILMAILGYERK